jgi:hypothetical protein
MRTGCGSCSASLIVSLTMVALLLAAPALAQDCPELVGSLLGGYPEELAVSGGYAYAADGASVPRLRVIDVSTPSAPVEVGVADAGLGWGVAVSDGYAYMVGGEIERGSLAVFDVSVPSAPFLVSPVYRMPPYPYDVAVSGHFAYVAVSWEWPGSYLWGLDVISVFTPAAPVEVGFLETPGRAYGVAIADGYAFLACGGYWPEYEDSLRVVDVFTPAAPVEVGFLETPGPAYGVTIADGYAFLACGGYWPEYEGCLRVVDVSTPALPFEVGFLATPTYAWDVAVSRGYAYVAVGDRYSGAGGLQVIDVSTPSAPVEVGSYETGGEFYEFAGGVAVSDGYVFLAAPGAGLYVFRECAMFSDGFESGNTSAWTVTVP